MPIGVAVCLDCLQPTSRHKSICIKSTYCIHITPLLAGLTAVSRHTGIKGNQKAAKWSNGSKYSKLKKHLEYTRPGYLRHLVKFKVKNMAKSQLNRYCYCPMLLMGTTKTAVPNKGHFASPLWVLISVLAQFHEKYFTNSSN